MNKEAIDELEKKLELLEKEESTIRETIKTLRELCVHSYNKTRDYNDSHYDYFICKKCGYEYQR